MHTGEGAATCPLFAVHFHEQLYECWKADHDVFPNQLFPAGLGLAAKCTWPKNWVAWKSKYLLVSMMQGEQTRDNTSVLDFVGYV